MAFLITILGIVVMFTGFFLATESWVSEILTALRSKDYASTLT
jgi:hypothetical protein